MARHRDARRHQILKEHKKCNDIEALGWLHLADAESVDEELTALIILLIARDRRRAIGRSRRYGPRGQYNQVKCLEFFETILYASSERWFRGWLRMDRESFWELHDHIKMHPIYKSESDRPQRAPHIQLATFFCRMGGETGLKSAGFSAIAEGTVWLYTLRTCHAIRSLRDQFIQWPEGEERDLISSWYEQHDFPGCVGDGDGTYFHSDVKPGENGYAFYCHKGFFAYVAQATCDHRGLITSYDFGWPGSVQDSRVFRLSHLWQNREQYFRPHEYILVDKGYPLTQYSIRPFQQYDITNDPAEAAVRKEWNRRLSSLRVTIEHVFGRIKGRFPYLRHITGRHTRVVYRIIEALFIVHNFLERRRDDPLEIPFFNGREDEDVDEVLRDAFGNGDRVHVDDDDMHRVGLLRRKYLVDLIRD